MSEEEKIEKSQKDSKIESPQGVNETDSPEPAIDETGPSIINEQLTTKLQAEEMEVHHHPHVEKKNFKEYFLEFIMIFLAVTLGFFAEGLREHIGDREKEKQNIESELRCLESDTVKLNYIIASNKLQVKFIDSLLTLKGENLHEPSINHKFYYYATNALFVDVYFKPNDAAMQQLKSSGMLRLIRKQKVIDTLLQYEISNRDLVSQQADHYAYAQKSWTTLEQVTDESILMDTSKFNLDQYNYDIQTFNYSNPDTVYITDDQKLIRLLFNNAAAEGLLTKIYILLLESQLQQAESIISFINKEYHLKDE